MGFTTTELEEFHRFANDQLSRGSVDISLEECLHRWRSIDGQREADLEAIRRGIADEQAGRVRPLADVVDDIRQKFGFDS